MAPTVHTVMRMRVPAPAIPLWRSGGRRLGVASAVSVGAHGVMALLVMGVIVRVPATVPPIRVTLYEPPPPPAVAASAGAPMQAPVAVAPERPRPVVHKPEPARKRVVLARSRPVPERSNPAAVTPPTADVLDAAAHEGSVPGGVPGGLAGGSVGGHGHTLIPADQAAHLPIPISEIKPEYPPIARLRGIEGQVVLEAIVARDGHIEPDITVIQSVPLLDRAAIAAVRQWRFRPALGGDGEPLRVTLRVPVRFVLR